MIMRRLQIRLRVAIASAVLTAIVLAFAGLIVYQRMGSELDASMVRSLRARADDIAALVQQSDSGLGDATGVKRPLADASAAQILTISGGVLDATPPFTHTPLISGRLLASAESTVIVASVTPVGEDTPMRVLAMPVFAQDQHLVIVVGASLEQRDDALANLLAQLLLVAPFALLLSGVAGWIVAAGALRPVASIRRAADTITRAQLDQRLPRGSRHDELGSLTDTLNAMLDRLADAARREQRFIADAAHELRSPLATLRAELELARRRPRDRQDLERVLDSALSETERLCRLADDLLLLALAERGTLELRLESVDVFELLSGVAKRFTATAALRHRSIQTEESETSLTIQADRLRIEQAVGNLVDNAFRHGEGMVALSAAGDGANIIIRVSDQGKGLPEAITQTAFRPFQRGPDVAAGVGSGLGLAIAGEIARAHGGTVRIGQPAKSYAVELVLPIARG